MSKILMIGPGPKSNGGISKVISYYKTIDLWEKMGSKWIHTHASGSAYLKLKTFIIGLLIFIREIANSDIVHLHYTSHSSANRKFIFFIIAKCFKVKVISHIHCPNIDTVVNNNNFSFRHMLKHSKNVIVLSELWKIELNKLVKREYIVVNNPSKGFVNKNQIKEKVILFAGKLEPRKGYKDLIKVLSEIPNILNNYRMVFAGDGELEEAKALVKKYDLRNIEILGWQDTQQITRLFETAEIFILPSYGEGFPISIIDALSAKCAIIATNVGGIPDKLIHNQNAYLFNAGNLTDLKKGIIKVVTDAQFKETISANGYETAKEEFDVTKIFKTVINLYSL